MNKSGNRAPLVSCIFRRCAVIIIGPNAMRGIKKRRVFERGVIFLAMYFFDINLFPALASQGKFHR